MFGRSRFTYLVSFLALLGAALAAKKYLYRIDFRSPDEVYEAGGLMSENPDGTGSVIDHVFNTLRNKDPWVSTTSSKKIAVRGATSPGYVYVYYLDPTNLNPVDTRKEFERQGIDHPHPGEKEYSVKGSIPWENIHKWVAYKRGKKRWSMTREEYEAQLECSA